MQPSPIVVWNETIISLMQGIAQPDDADIARRSTSEAGRVYALLNVAMHDAMAGIAGGPQLPQRWVQQTAPGVPDSLAVFAAIGAGCSMLENLFASPPREQQIRDTMRTLRDAHAGSGGVTGAITQALEYGKDVATALTNDARFVVPQADAANEPHLPATPPPEPVGRLGFAASAARYRRLTPFVLDRSDWFHAPPPQNLQGTAYAREWHEVYAVGSQHVRDQAPDSFESRMARLWRGGVGTSQETGFWLEIARAIVSDPARALSLTDQTRVMTAVAAANCDAMISSWSSKWTYSFWRPQDAIRRADLDGNPATFADPTWSAYNGSQGASPEHTSGTATFAGACSTVLSAFFGDEVEVTADFQRATGLATPETLRWLGLTADIAVRTRVWNGIHFASSGETGLQAGRAVGNMVVDRLGVALL